MFAARYRVFRVLALLSYKRCVPFLWKCVVEGDAVTQTKHGVMCQSHFQPSEICYNVEQ